MASLSTLIFQIAGLGLGIYRIWPEAASLLGAGAPTVMHTFEAGGSILLSCSLVLLPFMATVKPVMGNKLYSALTVFIYSGLCVILAHILRSSFVDGYVFFITVHKNWASLARPFAVLVIVFVNWLIAFHEMYRVVKVAGK
jgi:hypothetical protein